MRSQPPPLCLLPQRRLSLRLLSLCLPLRLLSLHRLSLHLCLLLLCLLPQRRLPLHLLSLCLPLLPRLRHLPRPLPRHRRPHRVPRS